MHKLMFLSEEQVAKYIDIKEVLASVENAFKSDALGKTVMPPKMYLGLYEQFNGDFRAMPAYVDGACGMKWVSVYPGNPAVGLRTVVAVIIYSDPGTGYPLAVMEGSLITDLRTGAAGGVAARWLARKNSTSLGVIGTGRQARAQLLAIKTALPAIKRVKVYEPKRENAGLAVSLVEDFKKKAEWDIRVAETMEEATDADIVVTTTPVTEPIVRNEYIKPGTHINAIGADAHGKEELEPEILKRARIIVDNIEQASHSGEINVPWSNGLIKKSDIAGTLGEVIVGLIKGRQKEEEITVFDSTGLAIQDMATARIVYEKAKQDKTVFHDWLS